MTISKIDKIDTKRVESLLSERGERESWSSFCLGRFGSESTSFLSFVDIRGVNLEGLNLIGVHFDGSDLRGANLSKAIAGGATFHYTNLEGADLSYSDLQFCSFGGAKMEKVNLKGANLCYAYGEANMIRTENIGGYHCVFSNGVLFVDNERLPSTKWSRFTPRLGPLCDCRSYCEHKRRRQILLNRWLEFKEEIFMWAGQWAEQDD